MEVLQMVHGGAPNEDGPDEGRTPNSALVARHGLRKTHIYGHVENFSSGGERLGSWVWYINLEQLVYNEQQSKSHSSFHPGG